ncbi:MAG TPA: hypothetical protein VGJ04_07390, partial [Pirellulales bacterium]
MSAGIVRPMWSQFYRILNNNLATLVSRRKPNRKVARDQETSGDPASSASNIPHQPAAKKQTAASPAVAKLRATQTADGSWQLVHPRCAVRRQE